MDINVNFKIMKFLEDVIENPDDLRYGHSFRYNTKGMIHEEIILNWRNGSKNKQMGLIKLTKVAHSKGNHRQNEKTKPILEWEKIFASDGISIWLNFKNIQKLI